MKKLTKKAIAAAPKYMVAIDWNSSYSGTIDHEMIEADNIFEAMQIADKMFSENVYLLAIMEKTDVIVENEFIAYADKLTSRTRGNWHLSDAEHGESPFMSIYHVEHGFAVIR